MHTKKILLGTFLLLGSCGCNSMSHTDKGVIGGGVLGAGAGALVGAATGNPGLGAAIGGIGGAAVGGVTGAIADNAKAQGRAEAVHEMHANQAALAAQKQMSMTDVIYLTQNHVSEHLIVQQIHNSGSTFKLSAQDILTLKQNGVSDMVVQEMQKRQFQPIYQPAPVVQKHVTVIHEVPPPPPVIRFGIGYHHYPHRRHCW